MSQQTDEFWMRHALKVAQRAANLGEVPVGAALVHNGKLISTGFNRRESLPSPLAHAELIAIEKAARRLGRWRLSGCTLYVTLEPCVMCSGAIVNSRVDRVVFGALDPKAGAVESLYQTLSDKRLNHRPEVTKGVLAEECSQILSRFFADLRARKNQTEI